MTSLSIQKYSAERTANVEERNYINQRSEVSEFFSGRKILITGGSGFLGGLILEKLLRSCPGIETIYLLMRGKKHKDTQTRFKEYFNNIIFERLKREVKDVEKKIVLIESDMSELNLGLSGEDRERIKDTEVIFHCAASVRFNDTLRLILNINVRGTRDLLLLARDMPNLKVFTYISTAFSHCVYRKIEEKFYDPPLQAEDIIKLTEILNDDQLDFITPKLLGEWPNTYTFSKAISEDVVRRYSNGIPSCIVRPSSVLATEKDPIPGWLNNLYGVTGAAVGTGMGVLRVMHCDPELVHDIIPADYVVNNIIVATWDTAKKRCMPSSIIRSVKDDKTTLINDETIPIYNVVTCAQNPISFKKIFRDLFEVVLTMPASKCLWYPYLILHKNIYFVHVCVFLLHWIPGIIVDTLAYLVGKKPMLLKIYGRIHKYRKLMSFFATNQWEFTNDNVLTLWEKLSIVDKDKFFFNVTNIDWDSYWLSYVKGMRVFLVKDPMETVNKAKILRKRLQIIHYTTVTMSFVLLLWVLYLLLHSLSLSFFSF